MVSREKVERIGKILADAGLDAESVERVKRLGLELDDVDFYNYVIGLIWNLKLRVGKGLAEIKKLLIYDYPA
jgi:hypothetical protein